MNWIEGPRPDITPPQIVATVIAGIPIVASLLRAFGVYDLSIEQELALSDAVKWASVLAGVLISGDAILRTGRNLRKGQVEAALASGPDVTPETMRVDESVLVPLRLTLPPPSMPGVDPATGQPSKTGFEEPPPSA